MPDDPPQRFPQNFQVGHTTISSITLLRLFRFSIGAMVLGVILAHVYGDFLEKHLILALICGGAYIVLCVIGLYFKVP